MPPLCAAKRFPLRSGTDNCPLTVGVSVAYSAAMTDFQTWLKVNGRGAQSEIARACNVTPQAVYQWKDVPVHHVLTVEKVTGIPRHKLRPELYPAAREAAA